MKNFQLGNSLLQFYNGGSNKDGSLSSETGNSAASLLKSSGNQMFIMFTSHSNGVGKGFTSKITFGNSIITT